VVAQPVKRGPILDYNGRDPGPVSLFLGLGPGVLDKDDLFPVHLRSLLGESASRRQRNPFSRPALPTDGRPTALRGDAGVADLVSPGRHRPPRRPGLLIDTTHKMRKRSSYPVTLKRISLFLIPCRRGDSKQNSTHPRTPIALRISSLTRQFAGPRHDIPCSDTSPPGHAALPKRPKRFRA
jgi:hypothetical protein